MHIGQQNIHYTAYKLNAVKKNSITTAEKVGFSQKVTCIIANVAQKIWNMQVLVFADIGFT